jgi:hypothetical protein
MNEPEDRPTSTDQPGPTGDQPAATWEDVVDPALPAPPPEAPPVVPPPPPPAAVDPGSIALPGTWPEPRPPRQPPPPAQPPAVAPPDRTRPTPPPPPAYSDVDPDVDDVDDYADDEYYDDEPISRWASLLATLGTALIGIVTIQVLASLVEGLTLKKGERVQIPDDLFHRLGYPFGGLGSTALVFLVLGVALVALPSVLDEVLSESQDRLVGVALIDAIVMGVIIALGSLLAVRANLHEYAAKGVAVPSYVRVQFTNFLLGALGAAALALFGAITAMNERSRERGD